MTPLQIHMMLHYYAIGEPYALCDPDHARSDAVREQRNQLQSDGLIQEVTDNESGFRVTPRGEAYVDALQKMPLPMQVWIMPPPDNAIRYD